MSARTPLQAIRAHCLWCCGGTEDGDTEPPYHPYGLVRECPSKRCHLHSLREGRRTAACQRSPLLCIRDHCFSCCGGGYEDRVRLGAHTYTRARPKRLIARCQRTDCSLFFYRYGKRP